MYCYTSSQGNFEVKFFNHKMYINRTPFKIVEDKKGEFVYKIQKTQIKAIDGVKGLEKLLANENPRVIGVGLGGCFVGRVINAYNKGLLKAAK